MSGIGCKISFNTPCGDKFNCEVINTHKHKGSLFYTVQFTTDDNITGILSVLNFNPVAIYQKYTEGNYQILA